MTAALAIDGGEPAVPKHLVEHNWQRYRKATQEEKEAVVAVLDSGLLGITAGKGLPNSAALEAEFAEWVGTEYCVVVDSGTAGLHCALRAVGVGPGDEVIVPALTFIASAMAAVYCGAVPVFVDVDPQTYLMDPLKIEARITERTKAILPVHIYGLPCDMAPITALAKKYNLRLLEDSAQAFGAQYRGDQTGTLAEAGVFSMSTTKQLMAGTGGLLTTHSAEIYRHACGTRQYGEAGDLSISSKAYQTEGIGWNYKLNEMVSALARVKLRHLNDYTDCAQNLCGQLTARIQGIDGLSSPYVPADRTHTYYYYSVQVHPEQIGLDIEPGKLRAAVMQALNSENVFVSGWQTSPVPAQHAFQKQNNPQTRSEPWCRHGSELSYDIDDYPVTWSLLDNSFVVWHLTEPSTTELVDRYADAFKKVFANINKVLEIFDRTTEYVPLAARKDRYRIPGSA